MNAIIQYLKETKAEMKNVTWPTSHQAISATVLVIIISVAIAYYLGLFDYLFSRGLDFIITKY